MKESNVLVAFDGSESSLRAVDFIGSRFSPKDLRVTLFNVLPEIPPQFWDDGHILTPEERDERQRVVDKWIANQKVVLAPLFEEARRVLVEKSFDNGQIEVKMRSDVTSVAEAILEEATIGDYETLVLGRWGTGRKGHALAGSVATTVLHKKGSGLTICIVE